MRGELEGNEQIFKLHIFNTINTIWGIRRTIEKNVIGINKKKSSICRARSYQFKAMKSAYLEI